MIKSILKFPDPKLRVVAETVTVFDKELKELTDDMFETMYEANGIGLAATQIGVPKRVAVIDVSPEKNEPLIFVNPAIKIFVDSENIEYEEGCLSVPGFYEPITRPSKFNILYQDLDGNKYEEKPEGLLTVVIQHEIDHINGKLFVDHISGLKRRRIKNKLSKNTK